MNFKDFIKFSWRKLIISILIIILTLLSVFISGFFFVFGGQQSITYYILLGIAYALVLPFFLSLHLADLFIGTGIDYVIVIIGLILTAPYIYFLSCLINLLIEKKTKAQSPSLRNQG